MFSYIFGILISLRGIICHVNEYILYRQPPPHTHTKNYMLFSFVSVEVSAPFEFSQSLQERFIFSSRSVDKRLAQSKLRSYKSKARDTGGIKSWDP